MEHNKENMPRHIAIIMDGNRRWAKAQGKPVSFGHKEGAKTLEKIVRYANKIGLEYITVYAFSTENWKRAEDEVKTLMLLLQAYLDDYAKRLNSNISFVDTYTTLLEHNKEDLFYRTDHHWTTLGAFYSYQRLGDFMNFTPKDSDDYDIELVSNSFNGALASKSGYDTKQKDKVRVYIPKDENDKVVVNYEEEQKKTATLYESDKLDEKDKYQVFLGGNHPIVKIDTSSTSGKTLLIFKDSYANSFTPFLLKDYKTITIVDYRYFSGNLQSIVESNNITDVLVLYEMSNFMKDKNLVKMMF